MHSNNKSKLHSNVEFFHVLSSNASIGKEEKCKELEDNLKEREIVT